MKLPTEIYKAALNKWGEAAQIDMMIEEAAELIHELNKYRRGRSSLAAVVEEIADVRIMAEQMSMIFGLVPVFNVMKKKLRRLEQRLERNGIEMKLE